MFNSVLPHKIPKTDLIYRGGQLAPLNKMDYDHYVLHEANVLAWTNQKEKECARAYAFITGPCRSPLTFEEFKKVYYNEKEDKKGLRYIANMFMSIFQSRRAAAGTGHETAITRIHEDAGIVFLKQVWVDKDGNIHAKKPKKIHAHKVDGLVPTSSNRKNVSEMYLISKKTTLRERWQQDLAIKSKGLILLTRETLTETTISNIACHNGIAVYPNAPITSKAWSYTKYLEQMKLAQKGLRDGAPQ